MKKIITTLVVLFVLTSLFGQTEKTNSSDSISKKITTENQLSSANSDENISEVINAWFDPLVDKLGKVLFWDPVKAMGFDIGTKVPIVVIWLIIGALVFTFYFKFINFWGFKHAIDIVRGKFDDPNDKGEVSHFQALTTALSATVGLGNIAGVAVAITIGGAGATFWMIVAGFIGMTSKFTECTLGVKYRKINSLGIVSGGPMYYLYMGLKKRKMKGLGSVLAVIFAILVVGASFGGGNMFQANQSFQSVALMVPAVAPYGAWYGLVLSILVAVVIVGGIKGIARVTDKLVPFMAVIYVGAALVVIALNIEHTGHAFSMIWNGAFGADALKGGFIGVLIVGFQRAAFSNEAGVGSAAIAHSAVKTDEPVSEGFVALLEPFVDTIVICTMTALVLIFTGYANYSGDLEGSQLTSVAFGSVISWFPYVLMVAIFMFAFSTMISWSYYGLKGFDYLFGGFSERRFGSRKVATRTYQLLFLIFVVIGSASSLGAVMDFSDMMILSMAIPNILGLLILAPEVRKDLKDYWRRVKSGEIKKFDK